MRKLYVFFLLFIVVLSAQDINAQSWEFFPGGTYNSSITRPQDFLGYDPGERFTYHYQILEYLKKLSEESDRIEFHTYGKSYEGRELVYLIISSPENLRRIEEIRSMNKKLADPRTMTDRSEAESIISNNPGIAWLSYGVHGNESCSSEAALLAAYQFAAGTDQLTNRLLDDLVIILDPLLNPDGRDKYVFNYNSTVDKVPNSSPLAMERTSSRGGRTNHYNFDLNRDWAFQTQIETRQRARLFLSWMPQVTVDFHEMGANSSYFFFPAADPINPTFPESVKKWGVIYGRGNAEAFDQHGWQYFTHEGFDLFYPGFGDSWPTFWGSIGMTYEQGGGGYAGIILERDKNDFITLRDRLWHHFTTSISTVKTLADNRDEALRDFYNFFDTSVSDPERGEISAVIIPRSKNQIKLNNLLSSLINQGIEIGTADENFRVRNAQGYLDKTSSDKDFESGDFVIKLNQPANRLIQVLFVPEQAFPDTFFYDLSAWAFPFATNLETYWTDSKVDVNTTLISEPPALTGGVENSNPRYAYILPLTGLESTLAVYDLVKKGVQGGISNREMTIEGKEFKRGSAVFYVGLSEDKNGFHRTIRETADKFGVTFTGVNTGMSDRGVDLGSRRVSKLEKPKIAIAGSDGPLRHMFDQKYNIEFTAIDPSQIPNLDIKDFNVLIVPSNISGALNNDVRRKSLQDWIRAGGVYIGIGRGVDYAISKDGGLASVTKAKKEEKKKEVKEEEEDIQKRESVVERERRRKQFASPGYFVKAIIDNSHPLGYGIDKEIAVLKFGTTAFDLTTTPAMVGRFDKEPKLAGYVHPENLAQISDKGYLYSGNMGSGHVILFSDSPTWREFLAGLEPILLNAVLLMVSQ
ncbi:M14 family zinc carboxypeptidase [candidate division KSB1 bacterium]